MELAETGLFREAPFRIKFIWFAAISCFLWPLNFIIYMKNLDLFSWKRRALIKTLQINQFVSFVLQNVFFSQKISRHSIHTPTKHQTSKAFIHNLHPQRSKFMQTANQIHNKSIKSMGTSHKIAFTSMLTHLINIIKKNTPRWFLLFYNLNVFFYCFLIKSHK